MAPIPEPMTMFRSVPRSEFGDVAPEDLRGFVVRDAGYFPASAAPTTAVPGEVQMQIDVPAGTLAAGSPDTSELIIDAGTEMSVDDIRTNPDGSTLMTLTALPPEGSGAPDGAPDSTPDAGAPEPEPAAPSFDDRLTAAATGPAAREATSASIVRDMEPELTDPQEYALDDYRADEFAPINRMLRGGDPSDPGDEGGSYADRERTQAWIDNIDSVMERGRLEREVQVWRGLDGSRLFGNRLGGDLTGMEWREDAYVSTSSDRSVSDVFAAGPDGTPNRNPVMMRVVVPPGVGAIELSHDRGFMPESELLLQHGLTMRVARDNGIVDGVRQIDVEVVPVG